MKWFASDMKSVKMINWTTNVIMIIHKYLNVKFFNITIQF